MVPRSFFTLLRSLGWSLLALLLLFTSIAAIVAWRSWDTFSSLAEQSDLADVSKMEAASRVLDREGNLIGTIQSINRTPIPLDKISPAMRSAIVATEDARFFRHFGIDPVGILRAAVQNFRGGTIRQGASTITQQLARDSFNIKERTYRRKLLEIALARRLETALTKDQILELYLNRIYFGAGLYGIESASQGYFGKPALELNPSESALLASLVRSPNALSPWRNPTRAEQGRLIVLGQMRDQGILTAAEFSKWKSSPPKIIPRQADRGDSYVVESVRLAMSALVPPRELLEGGLTIVTTIDSSIQAAAEQATRDHALMIERRPELTPRQTFSQFASHLEQNPPKPGAPNRTPPEYLQVAAIAVENATGGILALVGGRSFWHSEYNRVTQPRRPAAGLFAPFVALSALESGVGAHQTFEDWPLDNKYVGVGGAQGVLGEWGVEAEGNLYEGPIGLRHLLQAGKNAALARLGFAAGESALLSTALTAGFPVAEEFQASWYVSGLRCSPASLALAYTVFPRLGTRPSQLFLVSEILAPSGETIFKQPIESIPVTAPEKAWLVDDILREGMSQGPSAKVMDFFPNLQYAGVRTGTSYGFEDAWFAGYNDKVSLVTWIGFDRPSTIFRGAFGSELAAPIWAQIMSSLQDHLPPGPPPPPPSDLRKVEICRLGRGLLSPTCPTTPPPFREFSLSTELPECHLHSGAPAPVPRASEDSPWPRAQQLVDNRKIRPVNVSGGYISPTTDPYSSVSPASLSSPTARVEPAQTPAHNPEPSPVTP